MTTTQQTTVNLNRTVKFGAIELTTNGYDASIYEKVHDPRNIPAASEHPQNWSADALEDIAAFLQTPEAELPRRWRDLVFAGSMTRVSEAEIAETHRKLRAEQLAIDAQYSYSVSRGFFEDLARAKAYCATQKCIGIHAMSKRVHSDLFIQGRGSTTLTSPGGMSYSVAADIWIEGMKHTNAFGVNLHWPVSEQKDREKLREFLLNVQWPARYTMTPEFYEWSQGERKWQELAHHELRDTVADAGIIIREPKAFAMYVCAPLVGQFASLESFCRDLVAHLDEHFKTEGRLMSLDTSLQPSKPR